MTTDVPRVLIADDDPAIRPLVVVICNRLGFICDGAPDGETALERIRSTEYDVVLLDLMMPKLSGFEVIEALHELPRRPAVIVLTALGSKQTEGVVDGNVVHALIHKPFELDELTALIAQTARAMHEERQKSAGQTSE
jgi:two-component system response regulator VicR